MPRHTLEVADLIGACPICRLQYFGRIHNCPGELHNDRNKDLQNSQDFLADLEEYDNNERMRRTYHKRVQEGFSMLRTGGW